MMPDYSLSEPSPLSSSTTIRKSHGQIACEGDEVVSPLLIDALIVNVRIVGSPKPNPIRIVANDDSIYLAFCGNGSRIKDELRKGTRIVGLQSILLIQLANPEESGHGNRCV